MRRAAVSLAVLLLASACASSTISGPQVRDCHANADCGSGSSCQFSVYESCGNPGVCIASPDGSACIEQVACGCDGATVTVCLVNGNSPSPIMSLGSCDGATQQQGFDASVPDATVVSVPDASDSSTPVTPQDSSSGEDAAPPADASDGAAASTYGSPCNPAHGNADCTDSVYNQCGINDTCTKTCSHDSQCPDPPTPGTCNQTFDLCN
jgi:hypothetical protein